MGIAMLRRGASNKLLFLLLAVAACASAQAGTAWNGAVTSGKEFGVNVGGFAANAQDAMWSDGYGFEGVVPCAEARAALDCQPGEQLLSFQPLALGKKGHVYLKVESGRVSAIAWALTPVAYSDE